MKALFVGLGSIGRRHLANFAAECKERGLPCEVTALRHTGAELPEEVAPLVQRSIQELPEEQFDVAFITGPTHTHAKTLQMLQGKVNTYFIEKPIFEATHYSLEELGLTKDQKAYVAAPMRWCGVYQKMKEELKQLPVYSVRAICSSYLPGWRPAADYRTVYSAHADMGGGVGLDLIHEWDYLVDLFGFPQKSKGLRGRFSHLEIDSDDLATYIARYPGFLAEVHLDYFGRTYRRTLEVFSEQGMLEADFYTGQLTLPDGTKEDYAEPANRRYEREMHYFVEYALYGEGESINPPKTAQQIMDICLLEEWEPWMKSSF